MNTWLESDGWITDGAVMLRGSYCVETESAPEWKAVLMKGLLISATANSTVRLYPVAPGWYSDLRGVISHLDRKYTAMIGSVDSWHRSMTPTLGDVDDDLRVVMASRDGEIVALVMPMRWWL